MEEYTITFNEIDFIVPSYRYNFQFSYTSQQGLPFIREYILRLVQLGAMWPEQIATYFDLNEREVKEAINDLIQREELKYNEQNQVELTDKSKGYFDVLGGDLNTTELRSSGASLGFELTSFSCVSTQNKRLPNEWGLGFRLELPSKKVANRDKLVSKAFQKHFQELIEDGYMEHMTGRSGGLPKIYKVESVKQIGAEPLRLKIPFTMDSNGKAQDLEDFDNLKDSTEALELIAATINTYTGRNNYREVLDAIEMLNDRFSSQLFTSENLKPQEFAHLKLSQESQSQKHIPFIGSLYSDNNRKMFEDFFKKQKQKLTAEHHNGSVVLQYLAPSDPFWGKNDRLKSFLLELANQNKSKGKKPKKLYDFNVKLPFSSPMNTREGRREKIEWTRGFDFIKDNLFGYIEGYLNGVAEIILLEDRFVAVTYHLRLPESYRVPVPIGFISTDNGIINTVTQSLECNRAVNPIFSE
ncbi:hypothetical protein D5R81_11480 [Parashewanella spongiae]|uniref:Uncharacterized protein n=1 Tax=Parashewanella spongiae TaxID=342950 RepID=A0A3A6U5D6_9GAMM|nr:hypothetical protein [Parashewanella spongiae]MCL1078426.1 hypothetical protein [Parashewanella spongiae]RJY13307.1 hypothetical protein D5R81_11480 [Parashewanella spongiae]